MAVVVRHNETGQEWILLGTGFGIYKATRPSVFFGNLLPSDEEGQVTTVAVCDREGTIGWIHSNELTVVQVDGQSPSDILG